jgi:SAM-dependent methyltransferase
MIPQPETSWRGLSDESRDIWNANAGFWDDYFKEGNDFHRQLVGPAAERLLGVKAGETILEIACGNGAFARRMADLGARVVATDFSPVFVERARARSAGYADRIDYRVADAGQRDALLSLASVQYDAAVCNMALMDMADIGPLLETLPVLLKPGGRFVFTVMHPCFNSVGMTKIVEETDREGDLVAQYAIRVFGYLTPNAQKGLGIVGQPRPQYYFHRPLSVLLGACFKAGFVLDGLEEPAFPPESRANRPFSWSNYPEIPPVLAARLSVDSR